jgi:hypothetical protein
MDQFIDTIVRTHSLEEIQQNIPDIRWLAHAGGSMNADVVVHTALARKQAQHTEQRQYLTHKAAETTTVNNTAVSNYNIVTPEARRILSHLYKHRPQEAQQRHRPKGQPSDPLPSSKPSAQERLNDLQRRINERRTDPRETPIQYREAPHRVENRFRTLKTPIDSTNHVLRDKWYVENVPNPPTLTPNQINNLIPSTQQPFFLLSEGVALTNPDIVPHVWHFEESVETKRDCERYIPNLVNRFPQEADPRFVEAVGLTGGDSSLIALSAICSDTTANQAALYNRIADVIVQTHHERPEVLRDWLNVQGTYNGPDTVETSTDLYVNYDLERLNQGQTEDYALFPLQNGQFNPETFVNIWQNRLRELKQAVDQDEFTDYHHRWLEMLSKSIDIQQLIGLLRTKMPHEPVITVDTSTIRNAQNPQEALLHAVDAENNRAAAQHFIRQLDALKQNAQPVDNPGRQRQMYRNELGIEFDQGGWYNANLFLKYMKDRYNLPLALYISGGGFDAQGKRTAGVHANLITRIYQDGSDWKIEYWDPYRTGDSGRTLEDPSIRTATVSREDADSLFQNSIKFGDAQGLEALRVLNTNGIVASMDIGTVLTGGENSYNLSFSGEEVEVANTKEASLQPHQDAQNCVAYCMFNGLMRTAAKYDSHNPPPHLKDFFETGLTQFEQDWGIHVLKRDEIDRLQQRRTAA